MLILKIIIKTIIISLVFFLILYIVSSENFFTKRVGFKLQPMHIFIALIPFIIFLIVSGKLKEISGPWGMIALSMRGEAQKPVSPELSETPLEIQPGTVIEKKERCMLQKRIDQNIPTVLSFEVEKKNYYEQVVIKEYLRELEKHPDFRFILFTDADGKFKGFLKVSDFKAILKFGNLVQKLESGEIIKDPKLIRNSVQITSTNKQALNEMDRANVSMLAVVDREEKFIGFVTQEEIVRKILAKVLREL